VRGIAIRIEKLASQVNKDRQHIADIEALIQPVKDIQNQPLSQELTGELNDFLWLIQEYRISLFAQQLKTRVPVSAKRLDKKWAEISDQLRRFLVKSQ
jgi:ATP-dependent helicase HrpA